MKISLTLMQIIAIALLSILVSTVTEPAMADPIPVADSILVEKQNRRLYVIKDGKRVREYKVSLGWNPVGPKKYEGDGRTPEGQYVLDWRNPNSQFYKSIHISYPSPADEAYAESLGRDPGGMIMIHGSPNDSQQYVSNRFRSRENWTDGCIALTNAEMDELWRLVRDGTPITIEP